jgi:hypothetical protein
MSAQYARPDIVQGMIERRCCQFPVAKRAVASIRTCRVLAGEDGRYRDPISKYS